MPLSVGVTPGIEVDETTVITPAVLNQLGQPTITVTGTLDGTAGLAAASVANAHLQDNAVDGRVWDESASLTGVNLTATGALTGATLAISGAATFAGDVTLGNAAADALHLLAKLGSSTVQKTTPVDADQLILGDSAASDQLVRMTRAQFVRALLNIQTAHVAGTQTYGAASWTSVTSLQVTITPRSTDARILLVALINGGIATNGAQVYARFARNDGVSDTVIGSGTGAGSRQAAHTAMIDGGSGANGLCSCSLLYVDSPATTSARTYKVQLYGNTGAFYTGRSANDTDSALYARGGCSLLALEIP